MVRAYQHFLIVLLALLASHAAFALGTPADTPVTNNVTVDYDIGSGLQQQTDSVTFRVDNKIDLSLAVTNATVSPSQADQVITFVIQNDGNSTQGYALAFANSTVADDFNMNNERLYIEDGTTPGFQATEDTPYVSGSGNSIGTDVAADASITVYLVADVPPNGGGSAPADTTAARYDLLVTTLNPGSNTAATGSGSTAWNPAMMQNVFAEGSAGPHASDSNNDGRLSVTSLFSVNAPALAFNKSATVLDASGGNNPLDGATLTYTLQVDVSGSGNLDNVVITDPVPANTTYVANSLTLNSGALSDAADADVGDFNASNANSITVNLGTLNSGSGTQLITFSVTINP